MKIAIAQINPIIGDFQYNFNKIQEFADKAKILSCELVVFSELVISGYPPLDLLERKDFVDANLDCLNKLVNSIHGIGVICGSITKNPANTGKPLFNSAILFENGNILHQANKRLLPNYDVYSDSRYFESGLSYNFYSYKKHKIGLAICEDIWNDCAKNPISLMVKNGADIIVNVSASPFYVGKNKIRKNLLSTLAKKYNVPIIYANQVGGNDSLVFDGASMAVNRYGKVIVRTFDFKEDLITFDLKSSKCDLHQVSNSDTESILKALVMGTRDYVIKCGFKKVVIGLSGGIDSALTAYIAVQALGQENVLTVFMPSRYTSKESFEDAEKLAKNLGIELMHVSIDKIFQEYLKMLSPFFKENEPNITEQNIQARIRGNILMALSNQQERLVLSTGNKSELGVGYCTLYGDMVGSLAVISDVSKAIVYDIANFINTKKEYIPSNIIKKAPSAELKPEQTDQDDLPPYEKLDPIIKGYVEDLKGNNELIQMGFDKNIVKDVICKINQSEHKRVQAPCGIKITQKAFGLGRKYPVARYYQN